MAPNNKYSEIPGTAIDFSMQALGLSNLRNVRTEDNSSSPSHDSLDMRAQRPNDRRMTDLTRQEVEAKLAQNKAEVDARLANFDTSVKTGFAELRTEFAQVRTEMAKMRGDFEKQSHDSTKWIIGSMFGMISLAVAVIGVMINLNKTEKPGAAPAVQPAPIIITVPSTAPAALSSQQAAPAAATERKK